MLPTDSSPTPPLKPLYKGSCHCAHLTYTVRLDLQTPSPLTNSVLTKCNCTICHKSGTLLAIPEPSSLTILSPTTGRDSLNDYTFGSGKVHHWLCPKCGIKCFIEGTFTHESGEVHFTRVNVLTLDGRVDGVEMEDLRSLKPVYWDGRAFRSEAGKVVGDVKAPAAGPWEGGVW